MRRERSQQANQSGKSFLQHRCTQGLDARGADGIGELHQLGDGRVQLDLVAEVLADGFDGQVQRPTYVAVGIAQIGWPLHRLE